ncbi:MULTISPECIES: ComF family protein [Salinivibrio]|uniref:ComF family protein n=1 Tax=Salinivibrio TaxID=51366 RepID=UPI0009897385|nr:MULTISPECIES: ComF family protein [Salinivibrio]MPS32586.1 ComF family protein [Salinivibrio sp. VYel7]MPX90860.1 ComF family protein [Salinivibrio sp. VYel1]MPX93977.1 ComF family protein [Salinivibrio sp. VYel9]MPX96692.1 ComF family protein [Salinivibrio sp. VYel6]MPY00163.1 ComF family protein [Salinivibrio sp. VYel4]
MIPAINPRRLTRWLTHWRGKILPLQCPVCHLSLATTSVGATQALCCDACWDAHYQYHLCQCCGLPVTDSQARCGACLSHPPAWDHLFAISAYHDPLPQLVHAFKYQQAFELALPFARQLSERILHPAPVLLPVPLHWRRRWQRGFNQSVHLAWALADHLDTQVVDNVLVRHRHTAPQQGLSRQARLSNLKHAFAIRGELPSSHVAIVDDVVTTGQTVSQLCRLLRRAGAETIDIYCLARTDLP